MPEIKHLLDHRVVHPQVATVHDALAIELEARLLSQRHESQGREPTFHDRLLFLRLAEILVNARRRFKDD